MARGERTFIGLCLIGVACAIVAGSVSSRLYQVAGGASRQRYVSARDIERQTATAVQDAVYSASNLITLAIFLVGLFLLFKKDAPVPQNDEANDRPPADAECAKKDAPPPQEHEANDQAAADTDSESESSR